MAKKRREKTEDEEIDFKIPKFDEAKFLKREKRNIRTLFLSFLFGLLIAIISFGFWALLSESTFRWQLVFLLGIFNASWLRYLFLRLNIDLTDFGKKGWFTSYAIYFITWLFVLIILVNPPFYDNEPPNIDVATLPGMQEAGGTVLIAALIIDNAGVEKDEITFTITYPDGANVSPNFEFENHLFRYTYENTENIMGEYQYLITVTDASGLIKSVPGTFEYNNETLSITSTIIPNMRSGDPIVIIADEKISSENFRVYYQINNGSEINVNRDDPNDKETYETTAEYEGWTENTNVTVNVYVEAIYYFKNIAERFNNTVKDTTSYNFSTGLDANIGDDEPLLTYNCTLALLKKDQAPNTINYALPCPRGVSVPGFEVIIFLIPLLVVVLFFKYKKKDKKT